MEKTPITLRHRFALGDTVLFAGLVRDLATTCPDLDVHVVTNYPSIWEHDPHVRSVQQRPSVTHGEAVDLDWNPAIDSRGRLEGQPLHILAWYHRLFSKATGRDVWPLSPKGAVYLPPERDRRLIAGDYWLFFHGCKQDATVKAWNFAEAQRLVDMLRTFGVAVVQTGSLNTDCMHPPLEGVLNLVGTAENLFDVFALVKHARGVISGVSAGMHLAAVFDKPCVTLAGGREDPWFEAYVADYGAFGPSCPAPAVPHRFLSTIGSLPCCERESCWQNLVLPSAVKRDPKLCRMPTLTPERQVVAECMRRISAEVAFAAVRSYYEDGALPPPTESVDPLSSLTTSLPAADESQRTLARRRSDALFAYPRPAPGSPPPPEPAPTRPAGHPLTDRMTVAVLCYGDYPQLAERSIGSILDSVNRSQIDLHVIGNQLSEASRRVIRRFEPDVFDDSPENRKKYRPLGEQLRRTKTPYLCWFDDDTWIVRQDWLSLLGRAIRGFHEQDYRIYGSLMFHDLKNYFKLGHDPTRWFRDASWWRGIPFRGSHQGRETPNGSIIDFAVGWFWAGQVPSLLLSGVPDARLVHHGDICCLGEQPHQAGFKIYPFNKSKQIVACPDGKKLGRRGHDGVHPWTAPDLTDERI